VVEVESSGILEFAREVNECYFNYHDCFITTGGKLQYFLLCDMRGNGMRVSVRSERGGIAMDNTKAKKKGKKVG